MKLVGGGQRRTAGKTSLIEGLIRGVKSLGWTAVKISPHPHGLAGAAEHGALTDFGLIGERYASRQSDTGRFLAAGAKRALWLSAKPESLAAAVRCLQATLTGDSPVITESNSILEFLKPASCMVTISGARREFKPPARRILGRADAFAAPDRTLDFRRWLAIDARELRFKPVFRVSRGNASTETSAPSSDEDCCGQKWQSEFTTRQRTDNLWLHSVRRKSSRN